MELGALQLDVAAPSSERGFAGPSSERAFVHSFQVGSFLDGPGSRLVYWLSGCAMRCVYCHNPDTWRRRSGRETSAGEVLSRVAQYRRLLSVSGGGLTLSGGEPLVQARFCREVFRGAHLAGVHTALDTNGFLGHRLSDADLENIDLILLDLKAHDQILHRRVTGVGNEPVRRFAARLKARRRPVWLRFVLVPGWTDSPSEIRALARLAADLEVVERVEVLPFHQMGRYKWEALGREYALAGVPPPRSESVDSAREIFREEGLFCPE